MKLSSSELSELSEPAGLARAWGLKREALTKGVSGYSSIA